MRTPDPGDPRQVGGYRVLRLLGAGGMGRVYLGRSHGGRTVAIKVIRPEVAGDREFRTRFRREVDAARRVGDAWTAPVLDADTEAERPWLVTGYVPGPSLQDAVRDHGPLPVTGVRALGAGLAEALVAIHAAGLVHRDLKPSNVLLTLDGPRVIDFGISRAFDATALTHTGAPIGSPAFMSPEQIGARQVGPPSDVFSLGGVLVYAATGTVPFAAEGLPAVMYGILSQEPGLDRVPAEVREIITACLRKAPPDRPSPAEVAAALAPEGGGAAALVSAGWLPAVLVTELSRQAIALLDLEESPAEPGDPPSGPAAWSRASSQFGVTEAPTGRPGSVSVSVGLDPPGRRRRRPTAPLLAVVVAASLAAIIAVLLVVLPDSDGDPLVGTASTATAGPTGSQPTDGGATAGPTTDPVSSTGERIPVPTGTGPLPAEYVGTWQGRITSQRGVVQNVTMTLRAGVTGEIVAHSTVRVLGLSGLSGLTDDGLTGDDGKQIECVGDMRLTGVGVGVALQDVPGSGENPTLLGLPVCSSGDTIALRLEPDGRMSYSSTDEASGYPTGTLLRAP